MVWNLLGRDRRGAGPSVGSRMKIFRYNHRDNSRRAAVSSVDVTAERLVGWVMWSSMTFRSCDWIFVNR